MLPNDYYSYRLTWSVEDNEYVAKCLEFPSLSWLAADPESALVGIRQVVAGVVEDMKSNQEIIPEPISTKDFSGRFVVRVPPELHRELAMEAAESGISLNRLASDKLRK